MALHNIPGNATADGGNSVTFKVPRKFVQLFVIVLVMAVAIAAGLTIKERITDPVINKTGEIANTVVNDLASIPERDEAEADALARITDGFVRSQGLHPTQIEVQRISEEQFIGEQERVQNSRAVSWEHSSSLELYTFRVTAMEQIFVAATWRSGPEDEWRYTSVLIGR